MNPFATYEGLRLVYKLIESMHKQEEKRSGKINVDELLGVGKWKKQGPGAYKTNVGEDEWTISSQETESYGPKQWSLRENGEWWEYYPTLKTAKDGMRGFLEDKEVSTNKEIVEGLKRIEEK